MFDYMIVGCGFAGSVLAERLATQNDKKVIIVDRRFHIGGNAYDYYDESGLLVHGYGAHIFHTNSKRVWDYLSLFTPWRPYQHVVRSWVDGRLVPIPINLDTINMLYGMTLTSQGVGEYLQSVAIPIDRPRNSEEAVTSVVGTDLYEKFFRGYTRKQWGLDPSELQGSVTRRVPIRTNRDPRYFTDVYQAIPAHGYTYMFERMLSHPNIHVMLKTDYKNAMEEIKFRRLIVTSPIDEFFSYSHGRLPYRSLDFRFQTFDQEFFQEYATVNYPNDYAFTRITEFKRITGQVHPKTTIVYEFPQEIGDPYYPIPTDENAALYRLYAKDAERLKTVHFVGRLATYKYYNMDQVVAAALALHRTLGLGRTRARTAQQADSVPE